VDEFWSIPEDDVLVSVRSSRVGLTTGDVGSRPTGTRLHSAPARMAAWRLLLRQLESPIVLLLIAATVLSMLLGDVIDGAIILAITGASAGLGYVQERGAVRAVEALLATVRVHTDVRRDGQEVEVALDDVVVGDVLVLRAGDVIAGDARVLTSDALLLDESSLTGESLPVEKRPGLVEAAAPLAARWNTVWCGTNVASGTGTVVVCAVGSDTEFGRIGTQLAGAHIPTAFENGLRKFGYMIMRVAGLLVAAVFIVNVVLDRPIIESFLFSLALAVGLTPQLLPAIVTVTLSRGARQLAQRNVIVKRLDAIEDIGAIDVLCTDKTGTLTEGTVRLHAALDRDEVASEAVRRLAWINASQQRGFDNPIDRAIVEAVPAVSGVQMIDELPYDFTRRCLSVLVSDGCSRRIVTKGAVDAVLSRCHGSDIDRVAWSRRFEELATAGYRVIGIASRPVPPATGELEAADERALEFAGYLCFIDPLKTDAAAAIAELATLGVETKMISGDNRHAAGALARAIGLGNGEVIIGEQIRAATDYELIELVQRASVFARSSHCRRSASSRRSVEAGRASATSAMASTMRRRCGSPMWASRSTRRSMWPNTRRVSCCSRRILVYWPKGFARVVGCSPTR
jgi:P-type Mg2+ transporter